MAIDIKNLNHNQLGELISRAQQRQNDLAAEKIVKVREKVHALIKAEGFTVEDVLGTGGRAKARAKVKPKYRNPADKSQTWSGRGKRPRWFADALAAGKKEKDFLIG
ncbi:H-NS histone family protein [Dokdonella sp. MW10]|uniref:H-NS histone family protein n=1 Tax=Dokdonella sp. MW10 TaxID=2992926 RepID=UPI003F7F98B7